MSKKDEKTPNLAHLVTPPPDEDPREPMLGERMIDADEIDASPKIKRKDTGPLRMGVGSTKTGKTI